MSDKKKSTPKKTEPKVSTVEKHVREVHARLDKIVAAVNAALGTDIEPK